MRSGDEQDRAVDAKAALIDPASMTVVWANEAASRDLPEGTDVSSAWLTAEQALPMTGATGVPEAVREVAETGVPRHLRTGLVSTPKGGLAIVTSVYRLPDGRVLVLTENAWQPTHAKTEGTEARRRPGRRGR